MAALVPAIHKGGAGEADGCLVASGCNVDARNERGHDGQKRDLYIQDVSEHRGDPEATMRTYAGSCHCGAVRFEIETDLTWASQCTCSICTKKGVLHHRVPPERFKLLAGRDALALYQFGTRTAKHWFCRHCGIHPFSNPRVAPDKVTVNIRCLDDYDAVKANIEMRTFDGKNWEEALRTFKF
jgi:hypothetical protein